MFTWGEKMAEYELAEQTRMSPDGNGDADYIRWQTGYPDYDPMDGIVTAPRSVIKRRERKAVRRGAETRKALKRWHKQMVKKYGKDWDDIPF